MGESKFAPGPWYISIDNRSCPSVRNKGGYVCFAPSIHNYGDALKYIDDAAERQANIRLIAAAPDMYEAILQVLRADACGFDGMMDSALSDARAALAKAEGQDA